ncbi:MAG: NAD(P)-dependent oxidoreductase [Bacteroidota bacterium]
MTKNNRVLIADEMHESIVSLLKEAGFDPVYLPIIKREEILRLIPEFNGLVIRSKTDVDRELIDTASNLKFVARAGAGIDKLDVKYLEQKKIQVFNAPEGNRDALGEHALGMLLSLLHRLTISHTQVRKGVWNREGNRGIELKGKVVGIYGMGHMGMSFAKKLSGLDCEVLGYDKYKASLTTDYITQMSIEEMKERVEILSIHVPLQDDTRQLFTKASCSNQRETADSTKEKPLS